MVVAPWEGSICSARNNHNLQQGSALNLAILCRCFSLVRDFLVFDNLPLIETAEAGLLDSRDHCQRRRPVAPSGIVIMSIAQGIVRGMRDKGGVANR
jgi:hypothetical protein